ncbi:MAG: hypothetical protein AB4426_06875 [Xenococcaceae cyanobacterium]
MLHVIDIIGLSRERKYIQYIEPLLQHSSFDVRETADLALAEIASCQLPIEEQKKVLSR